MIIKPDFYDLFLCKANRCTDTCCAGWEIDIDEDALAKYKDYKGEFSERLNHGIVFSEGQAVFALDCDERCAFLNENGLCDIYSHMGESALCSICAEHPRFYNDFDDITEAGLGLCCEAVCEMLLEKTGYLTFCCEGDNISDDNDALYLIEIRNEIYDIIRSNSLAFSEKIAEIISFASDMQDELFGDETSIPFKNKSDAIEFVLKLYSNTEPINNEWTKYITHLLNNKTLKSVDYQPDYILYENLIMYILFRHFINSSFDGYLLNSIYFALSAIVFFYICECDVFSEKGFVSDEDKINIIKRWSKQIEYSDENTSMCLTFSD